MSIEKLRELETLASVCPELNMSNYTEDDVRHLNDWAIEMSLLSEKVAAIQQAKAQQPATGEPVYQIRKAFSQDAEWAWCDATEELFHMHPKEHRRILYTNPAPSVPDADRATVAGLSASAGHLSRLVDEQTMLLARAMLVMKALHESASPDDGPEMNAIIPAAAFREFVDADAALRYAVANGPVSIDAAMRAAAQAQKGQP